jgi:hypothetical protein
LTQSLGEVTLGLTRVRYLEKKMPADYVKIFTYLASACTLKETRSVARPVGSLAVLIPYPYAPPFHTTPLTRTHTSN